MQELNRFELLLKNLKPGVHEFRFILDETFFERFQNNLIKKGHFDAVATVEVSPEVIKFALIHEGYHLTNCDRCLEQIKLPVKSSGQILIKIVDEPQPEDEIIYLAKSVDKLDVAPLINELITVSLPIVKIYDCDEEEDAPCNFEVLERLSRLKKSSDISPAWDKLKNLKL